MTRPNPRGAVADGQRERIVDTALTLFAEYGESVCLVEPGAFRRALHDGQLSSQREVSKASSRRDFKLDRGVASMVYST